MSSYSERGQEPNRYSFQTTTATLRTRSFPEKFKTPTKDINFTYQGILICINSLLNSHNE
tara:strand:- start:14686 stop:14865 length:180 start_codon:yes stop_codon:yes gene_type:complete